MNTPAIDEVSVESTSAEAKAEGAIEDGATLAPTATISLTSQAEEKILQEISIDSEEGPTFDQQWVLDGLPSKGIAPELHNEIWLNSEPLKLADLRGKVVLLDMWTFG